MMAKSTVTIAAGIMAALQDPEHPSHLELMYLNDHLHELRAEQLIRAFHRYQEFEDWDRYVKSHPPSSETIGLLIVLSVEGYKSRRGKVAANKRHSKAGGSREKVEQIRQLWASGKYSSRDICAEQESSALGMSFSTARKALRNTPKPS